jgi:hypothetical protein
VADLKYDLAIDATGLGEPSLTAAGLQPPPAPLPPESETAAALLVGSVTLVGFAAGIRRV